jgi:CDP-glucose 4,6-dehydratase
MKNLKKFNWKNKRVLVTGATGFVGGNLYKRLTNLDAKVYGISRRGDGKRVYKVDIEDFKKLNDFIIDKKIQICFHLAAEALVESGQDNPYRTFKINIFGAVNVLESARINKLDKVIIASTSHVYGDTKTPYLEFYPPKPSRPYETSKTCTDLIAQSYARTFSLPVLIPRFVNIYGPGDLNFNRLIPKTVKSIIKNEAPRMWGGDAKRDYLFIDDVIDAYILLGEVEISKIGKNRIFNFGSDNIFSVKEVMREIIRLSGSKLKIKKIKDEREFEIRSQFSSWKKANRLLGWKPRYNFETGLEQTIEWYKSYLFDKKPQKTK